MNSIGDFRLSQHAIERALDMALDPQEIRECLLRPRDTAPSASHPGHQNYRLGRITCGVDPTTNTVVTIVWSSREDWKADLVDIGTYAGRAYRG